MPEVPPLPHADEVRAARAAVDRARRARLDAVRVDVVVRQLEALAALPVRPPGLPLPGGDALSLVVGALRVQPSDVDQLEGRLALFRTAAAVLEGEASSHDAHVDALSSALARQQAGMFEPSSRPTIAHLKALGAEQQAVVESLGALRPRRARIEPLVDVLERLLSVAGGSADVRMARGLEAMEHALEALGIELVEGTPRARASRALDQLRTLWDGLVEGIEREEARLAEVEARIEALTG